MVKPLRPAEKRRLLRIALIAAQPPRWLIQPGVAAALPPTVEITDAAEKEVPEDEGAEDPADDVGVDVGVQKAKRLLTSLFGFGSFLSCGLSGGRQQLEFDSHRQSLSCTREQLGGSSRYLISEKEESKRA